MRDLDEACAIADRIAPEHLEEGPLSKMMKPGVGTYDRFKEMFDRFSREAGKEQYLIPYFIAAHPGTSDEDMMSLALWLKKNGFRADQVQTFYPSPMATATAMYHTLRNPLRKITPDSERVDVVKGERRRRLHKAFLRYHDANNWPILRELDVLDDLGLPVLWGASRKRFLGDLLPDSDGVPRDLAGRESATVALTTYLALAGAWAVRVHDVRASRDAIEVVERLTS